MKPVTVWCIVDKKGKIQMDPVSRRKEADAFCAMMPQGYTVRKFKLVPVEKARGK